MWEKLGQWDGLASKGIYQQAKFKDWTLVPGSFWKERIYWLPQVVLWPLHAHSGKHTHAVNECNLKMTVLKLQYFSNKNKRAKATQK